MDFSGWKQFLKSRKGGYVVFGAVGVAAIGVVAAIGLSEPRIAAKVDHEMVWMEQSVALEQEQRTDEMMETVLTEEIRTQMEAEDAVKEEIFNEEASESNEDKKMKKRRYSQ